MGCRGQVKISMGENEPAVFLYTHYDAYRLGKIVQTALKKRQRWDDDEYLARIIFDEMTKDCYNKETGFGIGTSQHADIECLVEINGQIIVIDRSMCSGKRGEPQTFDEFIEMEISEAE
jgi:hypothetical protein